MAERISWLLDHPEEAHKMGIKGRNRVLKEFGLERLISNMGRLYQELAQEKKLPESIQSARWD